MVKSKGLRVYEVYNRLPESVKKHTDKMIRITAKATKGFRDRATVERRGKKWMTDQRKKLHL